MSRVLRNYSNQVTVPYGNGHNGIDIVGSSSRADDIVAHTSGTVVLVATGYKNAKGSTGAASWGNRVMIQHAGGYYTQYAHLARVNVVKGQRVNKGQVIGSMGDSGNAYGVHLHFEVYKGGSASGYRINPTPYINADLPSNSTVRASSGASAGSTGDITYTGYDLVSKFWHAEVVNDRDFAGSSKGHQLGGFKAKCKNGLIYINSHVKGAADNIWCGEVSSANYGGTGSNSYSGTLGSPIDKVKIRSTKGYVLYRVKTAERGWLPWVDSRNTNDYAGNKGEAIIGIQMK